MQNSKFRNYLEKIRTTGVWLNTMFIFLRNGQIYTGWCRQDGTIQIDAIKPWEVKYWFYVYDG